MRTVKAECFEMMIEVIVSRHSVHTWCLHLGSSQPAVWPPRACTVPDNCGTIFIPGDRWPKRATHILPPCLLEMTLRPAPNQMNHPRAQCQSRSSWRPRSRESQVCFPVCCLMLLSIHPLSISHVDAEENHWLKIRFKDSPAV